MLGLEAGEEGRGDGRHRDAGVHGGLHGPAPLPRVRGDVVEVLETRVGLQAEHEQVEQPRPDDRALLPRRQGGRHVDGERVPRHQLVALGEGLHDGVLDAVVDHLREVPGADLADVGQTGAGAAGLDRVALGGERLEDRPDAGDVLVGAADHQGVPVLEAPHPAGHAGVDEADASLGEPGGVVDGVREGAVPALDDQVALAEQPVELVQHAVGRIARGHHHPHGSGRLERPDQRGQRVDVALVAVRVEAHHVVAAAAEALGHVPAHPAEADHPESHRDLSSSDVRCRPFLPARAPRPTRVHARPPRGLGNDHVGFPARLGQGGTARMIATGVSVTASDTTVESPFKKGDHVIYPQHGAGKVVAVEKRTIGDTEREYLVVELELQDLRVWVPVDEAEQVGVREPTPPEELEDLFELLSDHDVRIPANFSRRMKNNQSRMNDGDVWQLAEVVRNLAIRRSKKHLSPSEKTLYAHARNLLIAELALTMGKDHEATEAEIDKRLPEPGDED